MFQCRDLLSKENFVKVKKSLILLQKEKDIKCMRECIEILLEQPSTEHIIDCKYTLLPYLLAPINEAFPHYGNESEK